MGQRCESNSSLPPCRLFSLTLKQSCVQPSMANLCWLPRIFSSSFLTWGAGSSHRCICDGRLRERGQERKRRSWGEGDESFMRRRAGVGNHNENAKIELFSRTAGGVMRVKTAGRCLRKGGLGGGVRGWGSQGMKIAPGHDKKRKKGLIIGILIPLFLSVPTFLYCLYPVISSFFLFPTGFVFHLFHPLSHWKLLLCYF